MAFKLEKLCFSKNSLKLGTYKKGRGIAAFLRQSSVHTFAPEACHKASFSKQSFSFLYAFYEGSDRLQNLKRWFLDG